MAYVDHRQVEAMKGNQSGGRGWHFPAQATNQSNRGFDFRPSDDVPMWFRAVAEVLRPRSIIILLALAGVTALWWL